ncbi:hypothetical protein BGZ81_005892 [Podila clonocystis]|nr:hypothetical protein BGZ81_005892 [Podila clonocystis]
MPTSPSKVVAPNTTTKKDSKPQGNRKTRSQKSKNAKEKGKNNKPQKYMMDVGLFDEDVVVPPAPAVLSSVIFASQPTAIPAVDPVVDPVVPVSPMEAPPPEATPPPPPPAPSVA